MAKITCIYCYEEISAGSGEHVILSALGGKKQSRSLCCEKCNNRLGNEIDRDIAEQLQIFSNMIGIITGRNKPAPTILGFKMGDGSSVNLESGGKPTLAKASVKTNKREDGSVEVNIMARNIEEAKTLLEHQFKRFGKSLPMGREIPFRKVHSYPEGKQLRFSLGGKQHFRAIGKMMLNYLSTKVAHEVIRDGSLKRFIAFVNSGAELPDNWINHDYDSAFPVRTGPKSDFDHRVIIYANFKTKTVIGFVELFGSIRFSAVLSDDWRGPDIAHAYIIDPVTHEQREEQLTLPSDLSIDSLLRRTYNLDKIREAFQLLLSNIFERQQKAVLTGIVDKAIEKHKVGHGDYITEEMINRLVHEVATEFMYYNQRLTHIEGEDLGA